MTAARTSGTVDRAGARSGRLPSRAPESARLELVCARCLYGVVVSRPPARCPMCGSDEWLQPQSGTARAGRMAEPGAVRSPRPGGETRTTIRIEARSRWDALDLTHTLPRCDWFMVAHAGDHWDVCVRADPRRRRLVRHVVEAARAWAARRRLETVVHLPGRDLALRPQDRAERDRRAGDIGGRDNGPAR